MNNQFSSSPDSLDQARLAAVARYRRVVGGAALLIGAGFTIHGLNGIYTGCMDALAGMADIIVFGVPLLLIGFASLYIARLLTTRPRQGLWSAVVFDSIVVIPSIVWVTYMTGRYILYGGHQTLGITLLTYLIIWTPAMIFAADAAWLLRGWRWFGAIAGVFVVLGIGGPVLAHSLQVRQVRPLLAYVDAHWVSVPGNSPITVARRQTGGGSHTDYVGFRDGDIRWFVNARHEASNGWRFGSGEEFAVDGSRRGPTLVISSPNQALQYLRTVGIDDGTAASARSVKDKWGNDQFLITSTKIGGYYIVKTYGDVEIHLSKPLVVPDPLR